MGIFEGNTKIKVPRLDFELTTACDHKCAHCYNVWTAKKNDVQAGYPLGQLPTDEYLVMMEKAVLQSGASHITLTGGEPLLHKDADKIIEKACSLVKTVQVVTNGSHISSEIVEVMLRSKVRSVQLTLLSADPFKHNQLKGVDSFDSIMRAVMDLRDAKIPVQICFVAMQQNWQDFAEVIELCFALGIKSIAYNRMSPAGGAIHYIKDLLPSVEQVEANLQTADNLGRKWKIYIATAMPIPPCLIRIDRYKWIKFGFCSNGTSSPNFVIDPIGNVRSCNLSSNVLGNIVRQDWKTIMKNSYKRKFKKSLPSICRGCAYEKTCQGGCKESAFATFGSLDHPEPFLYFALKDKDFYSKASNLS